MGMFENVGGWGSLHGVRACIDGSKCKDLTLFSGATWTGCPKGEGENSISFELTQRSPSGQSSSVTCDCGGSWPWATGKRCSCPRNFAGSGSKTNTNTNTNANPNMNSNTNSNTGGGGSSGSCPAIDSAACDCSWASSKSCTKDDLSKCWCQCCCPKGATCANGASNTNTGSEADSSVMDASI